MAEMISEIWEGLCAAGIPEVMLYLPDNSAARCHWRDTADISGVRVALIADQERKIVRIVPVDTCVGIGVASPKGVDPTGHRSLVLGKIVQQFPQPPDKFAVIPEEPKIEEKPEHDAQPPPPAVAAPVAEPAPPTLAVEQVVQAAAVAPPPGRFGNMTRQPETKVPVAAGAGQGMSRPGERGWKRA